MTLIVSTKWRAIFLLLLLLLQPLLLLLLLVILPQYGGLVPLLGLSETLTRTTKRELWRGTIAEGGKTSMRRREKKQKRSPLLPCWGKGRLGKQGLASQTPRARWEW